MTDVKPPEEGLDTLSAQFTYEAVRKVVSAIQALRKKGLTEPQILDKVERELKHFDAHSRQRMYHKSLNEPIADDFPEEQVVEVESPKANTYRVKMQSAPQGIREEMLVQFRGEDYYVAAVTGLSYMLKKLVPKETRK